jgi:hypothetical protein
MTTSSVVSVSGAAVADGAGLGAVGAAFWAHAMLTQKSSMVAAVKVLFMRDICEINFQSWWW